MRAIPHAAYKRTLWAVLLAGLLAGSYAIGQQPVIWKTGAAFTRQLREEVGVPVARAPVRDLLDRLSRAYGTAVFLDRRIDPDQQIDFTARDVPLESLWRQIAAAAHAEAAIIGSVIYMGPSETAAQLAAIAAQRRQDVTRLPNDVKARLLKTEAWKWDELAQPRDLLRELARQGGVRVQNADAMPHDLWPAVELPPLAWADRMTLLLAGFGLTFEVDPRGESIRLVSAPAAVVVDRHPPAAPSAGGPKSPKKAGEKLYSLNVANEPAGNVVSTVAKSLGKELSYDSAVAEKLQQRVTFDLKDATLEYLLEATLKPLGLAYRLSEKQLEITAAKK